MAKTDNLTDFLTDLADGIRSKTGETGAINPQDFRSKVEGIETGGGLELNIAYGDTAPGDTSKLWVKCDEPTAVNVSPEPSMAEKLITLQTEASRYYSAAMVHDGKIYLRAGVFVHVFDPETETIEEYTASGVTFYSTSYSTVGMVGMKMYFFGAGSSPGTEIWEYDLETDTATKLSVTLPIGAYQNNLPAATATVGTKIYMFGGNVNQRTHIYIFDSETRTLTISDTTLPKGVRSIAAVTLGTKIYLIGGDCGNEKSTSNSWYYGSSDVHVYDTENDTIETCGSITKGLYGTGVAAVGTKIYIFGGAYESGSTSSGSSPSYVNTIYVYDTETNTCKTHDLTVPYETNGIEAAAVGDCIYLFGAGVAYENLMLGKVVDLESGALQIIHGNGSYDFNLINSDGVVATISVASVLRGDDEGVGRRETAYLHNGNKWADVYGPFYKAACAEVTSDTTLSASVECSEGDLVIAAIATRDTLTLSDGWTLISTSEVNSTDTTNGQRLSFAYKYAESEKETITVTQASAQRLYINLVSLSGATGFTDNGYAYNDTTATSITVTKPAGLVLWACSAVGWLNTNPLWTVSNNSTIIQLGADTASRLAVVLDESEDESVTFTAGGASTTTIVGSLTIEGMDAFA